MNDYLARTNPPTEPDNLLTNNQSFEDVDDAGQIVGWAIGDHSDAAQISSVTEEVVHGRRAVKVSSQGSPKYGFVRVVSDQIISVSSDNRAFQISASVRNRSFSLAGLQVLWYTRIGDKTEFVGESFSALTERRSKYTQIEDIVRPPAWSDPSQCRVALFGWGSGALEVDNVSLKIVDEDDDGASKRELVLPSKIDRQSDLQFLFNADGTFAIRRGRQVLCRNVRLAEVDESYAPFGQLLAGRASQPDSAELTYSYEFMTRGGKPATIQQLVQVIGDQAKVSYQRADESEAQLDVLFELNPQAIDLPVKAYLDDRLVAEDVQLGELEGVRANELIIGSQRRQSVVTFTSPLTCYQLPDSLSRGPKTLHFQVDPGVEILDLFFSSVSQRDEKRIAESERAITELLAERKYGQAIQRLEELQTAFPSRQDLKSRCEKRIQEILEIGEREVARLTKVFQDYEKFQNEPVYGYFEESTQTLASRFAGTAPGREAERLRSEAEATSVRSSQSQKSREAQTMLNRAQNYLDNQLNHLARLYAERVESVTDDDDLLTEAQRILRRAKARE